MTTWKNQFESVWEDVNWDRCCRRTQNNLRGIKSHIEDVELENQLLKLECIKLFNRLIEIAKSEQTFDLEYLENWLKEKKEVKNELGKNVTKSF